MPKNTNKLSYIFNNSFKIKATYEKGFNLDWFKSFLSLISQYTTNCKFY